MAQARQFDAAQLPRGFRGLMSSFEIMEKANNIKPLTIERYLGGVTRLGLWLQERHYAGPTLDMTKVTRAMLEECVADHLDRYEASTISTHYASWRIWFKWLYEEDEITANPMARMRAPRVLEKLPPTPPDGAIRAILATCRRGKTFEDRRDYAILRVLLLGLRRKEIVGLDVADVDFDQYALNVSHTKGGRPRVLPFGNEAAAALDRYIKRAREGHRYVDQPALWLSQRGRLSYASMYRVVRARCAQAGYEAYHPHLFRHETAHNLLQAGMNVSDLKILMGWKKDMSGLYGASLAAERARDAYRALTPDDRF